VQAPPAFVGAVSLVAHVLQSGSPMIHPYRAGAALAAVLVCFTLPLPAEVIHAKSGDVSVESLAKLDNPFGMAFLPDGRLLITEKPGTLRIFADGKLSEPIAGVPSVAYKGQGGMLDVEIDPDFPKNNLVYLSYTEAAEQQPPDAKDPGDPRFATYLDTTDVTLKGGVVARARLNEDKLEDLKVIWRQVPKTIGRGHYSCRMTFSPDGKLFIASGERQRFDPAQDLESNLGKIVRINSDGSIPDDNPFVKQPGALRDVWTLGNRNPLGIAFDPATKKLWVNEMGPKGGDELNLIEPGKNYGWPVVSEGVHYGDQPIPKHSTRAEFTPPVKEWTPVISPSGMIFYTGDRFPAWKGSALIGGLSSKAVIRVKIEGDRATEEERLEMGKRIRDVIQAADGTVLLLTDGAGAELLRLTPVATAAKQ
jgi:aldose sugar dehydrogenase